MRLQVGELRECLTAAGVLTLVGLLASVGADVLLQVTQLREATLAYRAAVRLYPRMYTSMLRQVGGVGKALLTRLAFIGFGVLLVNVLTVHKQVRFRVEDLITHSAVVGLYSCPGWLSRPGNDQGTRLVHVGR